MCRVMDIRFEIKYCMFKFYYTMHILGGIKHLGQFFKIYKIRNRFKKYKR